MNIILKLHKYKACGFTLAELLIALAILGVIATFTIPKILQSQQNSTYKTSAKEAAGTITGAYTVFLQNNPTYVGMTAHNLSPYMNYVSVDTSSTVDDVYTATTKSCSGFGIRCLRLHSGAVMRYDANQNFASSATTNAIYFMIDPDGAVTDGTTNGPGKSVLLFLYPTGRLTNAGGVVANTTVGGGNWGPTPAYDPPWFSWN